MDIHLIYKNLNLELRDKSYIVDENSLTLFKNIFKAKGEILNYGTGKETIAVVCAI